MNIHTIEKRLILHSEMSGQTLVAKNIYLFDRWESDVLTVSYDDRTTEIEIKRSRSDFLADFKKEEKHYQTSNGYGANYFYFACPDKLITLDEIPEYAGLIYVNPKGAWIKKKAPQLHNDLMSFKQLKKVAERIYITKLR